MCFKKIIAFFCAFILIIFASSMSLASSDIYVWSPTSEPLNSIETSSNTAKEIQSKLTNANITDLKLESGGAVLIEQNSGQVLYDHNMHEKLRPASVTKVMSLILIMEAIDSGRISYTDKIPCTETASAMGGSQIWLDVREELTVDEMLKAICVVSANDCTVQ